MKILSLGHSSYLLEMIPAQKEPVRILADPWLSDYLIGDLMGRFPRLRIDLRALQPIDGIFLSHSHTDHLDPYSLLQLFETLDPTPALLLPQSLKYLQPLLGEYLGEPEIVELCQDSDMDFRGLKLSAFFNPELHASNEDDAMILVAEGGDEIFLAEGDALMPLYDPGARGELAERLRGDNARTACFLTVKNQGNSIMSMLAADNREERNELLGQGVETAYAEIFDIYNPAGEETDALWNNPALVRLITGQGICFPQAINAPYNHILFPIRLEDQVRMEREVAAQFGYSHSIEEMIPGHLHEISGGKLQSCSPAAGVSLLDEEKERHFDPGSDCTQSFPQAPLLDEKRDTNAQRERIADCLQNRFLPWLIGSRTPPLEHLLAERKGEYRIRLRFGTTGEYEETDYLAGFAQLAFNATTASGQPDEYYWANDIEDVLDGRADEFSLGCRHPLEGKAQRLWCCLGLPFLNNDLIEKKLRLHFERAARGENSNSWVEPYWLQSATPPLA